METIVNEQVKKLKKNIEAATLKSKETVEAVVESNTKILESAMDKSQKVIEDITNKVRENKLDIKVLDSVKRTFNNSVELSETMIDSIIDSYTKQMDAAIEFNSKMIETIKSTENPKAIDMNSILELTTNNFENTVKLASDSMKQIIDNYNQHTNLAVNFNKKISENINEQMAIFSKSQTQNMESMADFVAEWYKK